MFPIRLAAIDIGSNAIRFLAVQADAPAEMRVLDQVRAPIRLGHDVFSTGRISAATMDSAAAVLRDYAERMRALNVTRSRAVATSAAREAVNGGELVARARVAGIGLELIAGVEEARLAHAAVRDRIPLGAERWLLIDLGGGSLEVSTIDVAGIYDTVSLPLGAVRLIEQVGATASAAEFETRIAAQLDGLRHAAALQRAAAGLIATGGNIEELVRLVLGEQRPRPAAITTAEIAALAARLGALTIEQRVQQLRLRRDRADVILPAALVYRQVAELAGFETLLVPGTGVKEGIIADLLPVRS